MSKYALDYDPLTKTESYLHSDSDGNMVIQAVQDAEDIIDHNARMAENLDKKADWWFIGSIPLQICVQWAQESSTKVFTKEWQAYAKKQMQLPEYRKLNPNRIRL